MHIQCETESAMLKLIIGLSFCSLNIKLGAPPLQRAIDLRGFSQHGIKLVQIMKEMGYSLIECLCDIMNSVKLGVRFEISQVFFGYFWFLLQVLWSCLFQKHHGICVMFYFIWLGNSSLPLNAGFFCKYMAFFYFPLQIRFSWLVGTLQKEIHFLYLTNVMSIAIFLHIGPMIP